jgi:hypothetical protein
MSAAQPIDWPALIMKALADVKANLPLPPSAPMTEAEIEAMLAAVEADLPAFAAEVRARPGLITAAGRVLAALEAEGKPWAGTIRTALCALPGGLASAEKFIPTAISALKMFSPVPGKFLGIN